MRIDWMTAFIDTPAASSGPTEAFWAAVTGSTLSPRRGAHDEFATLLPPTGDAYLRLQVLASGPARIHLDISSDALPATAERPGEGAARTAGYETRRSPGGFEFCLQASPSAPFSRPDPVQLSETSYSRIDQISLDIPAGLLDAEVQFWADLTGWTAHAGARPEFHYLDRPDGVPLRILFQRLDSSATGRVSAHLDIACTDRPAEVERHLSLGAGIVRQMELWTTLQDPAGRPYCLTDRDAFTGRLR